MIIFKAKKDGTVETLPSLVPQGSSMQELVVLSEFNYALCTINLYPASGTYIEPLICQPVRTDGGITILWTASLPPEATVIPGQVAYQLVFSAADGTKQSTLMGTFTVPRGVIVNVPNDVDSLGNMTINDLYTLLSNIVSVVHGNDQEIEQIKKIWVASGNVTIPASEWHDTTPTTATFSIPKLSAGQSVIMIPSNKASKNAAVAAKLSAYPTPIYNIGGDIIELIVASSDSVPAVDMDFVYMVISSYSESTPPTVAIIGVDATGDGGGLDEEAVRDLINEALHEFEPGSGGGGLTDLEVRLIVNEVVPKWALSSKKPSYTASEVGADTVNTAATKVSEHDTYTESHQDIRLLIKALQKQVNKFLDVDDATRDELSEVLALIDANADTLERLTSGKVNVTDIVNNLTSTNVSDKPLSAAQGAVLKGLIDTINAKNYITEDEADDKYLTDASLPTNVSQLNNDSGYITQTTADGRYAKSEDIPTTPSEVGADREGAAADVADQVAKDLMSYYKKTETYSKTEVDNKISAIPKFAISVVSSLPTSNISETTVYLLKNKSTTGDLYTEYIYVNGAWEELGRQTVNLSGYATITELYIALASYAKTSDIPNKTSQLTNDSNFAVTTKAETWTFTLDDGTTVDKKVVLA